MRLTKRRIYLLILNNSRNKAYKNAYGYAFLTKMMKKQASAPYAEAEFWLILHTYCIVCIKMMVKLYESFTICAIENMVKM